MHRQTLVTVMAMFKGLFLCSFLGSHHFQLSSGVIMKYFEAEMVLSSWSGVGCVFWGGRMGVARNVPHISTKHRISLCFTLI